MTVESDKKSSLLRGEFFFPAFEKLFKGIKHLGTRYSFSIHKPPNYAAKLDIYEDIRYVRISVNGNSVSNWASVAEVEIWAEKE